MVGHNQFVTATEEVDETSSIFTRYACYLLIGKYGRNLLIIDRRLDKMKKIKFK